MKNLRHILKVLFTPLCWLQNYRYNSAYDSALNYSLDKHGIVQISECEAKTGNLSLWVANYPYAFATPYTVRNSEQRRPSRKTIFRVRDMLGDDYNKFNNGREAMDNVIKGIYSE